MLMDHADAGSDRVARRMLGELATLEDIPPLSGAIIPNRIFIKVLLPEPFSPRRPTIWPAATSRLMPAFARTPPNDLTMSLISRSGCDCGTELRPGLVSPTPEACSGELDAQRRHTR